VFGERRIEAYKMLGRDHIPARIVHVSSIAQGEHDENELRKEFTHSERDAIRRSLGHKPEGRPSDNSADLPNYADGAASVGYSERTARNVESVVDHGTAELVAAMDKGEISIDAAATIAKEPRAEQTRIVTSSPPERKAAVRRLRDEKKSPAAPSTPVPATYVPPRPEAPVLSLPAEGTDFRSVNFCPRDNNDDDTTESFRVPRRPLRKLARVLVDKLTEADVVELIGLLQDHLRIPHPADDTSATRH
jgi:ParB-like chromosome segregation protein Spo0J